MTIPSQPPTPTTDPRRPSVSTSSLPLVGGSPYGHHRLPNLAQQPSYYSTSPPPLPPPPSLSYHSSLPYPQSSAYSNGSRANTPPPPLIATAVAAPTGLVNTNMSRNTPPPPALLMKNNHHYHNNNDHHQHPLNHHHLQQQPQHDNTAEDHSPSSPTNDNSSYRPLNVADALTYLDQVKGRFSDKPNVYNQFLDIMKDFKTQIIDTPGVIERVSTLFKGHPHLISGFNTFLPAGYRIDCSMDPRDPNRIIVTTPNGNTTSSTTTTAEEFAARASSPPAQQQQYYYPYGHQPPLPPQSLPNLQQQTTLPPPSFATNNHHHGGIANGNGLYSNNKAIQPSPPPPVPPLIAQQQQREPPIIPRSVSPPPVNERRSPVEFNHAINYVNRIKNRFAHSPEIYKQFLEILQTYQKEQKQIKEVYSHVKLLFNGGAEDLLEEFKQFLPTIQNSQEEVPSSPQAYGGGLKRLTMSSLQQPPGVAQKKKKTYRKRSMLQQQQEDLHHHQEDHTISSSFTAFDPSKPSVSLEETDLFDRIKAHIGTKPSWEEFLKTLNLYTQQIVDMGLLIVQVKDFFQGDKELFDTFKKAIGYDPKEHPIERPSHSAEKPDLATCDAVIYSPSYRIVPKDWQNQPCSGRDQLCWEVLNDQFVSHPIWASEDSGFVASKKNSCEEALHRCEEERYEYDLNIEANLNTIALLEPIALRIQTMTPEEQNNMRLEPGLGGPTVSIYERIIKKVYDNDRGSEIIDMLYKRPATVIPVLLNRLKMKDKEWKKAQREWNKIWRDTDDKNFYRSLDYQGTTFKANDKKALIARALITEMDAKKKDTFVFEDKEVFKDVYHLIFDYMDNQSSGGFAKGDKQKIREFLRTFIPTFFQVKEERDDAQAGDDTAEYSSEDISAGGDSASPVINKEKNANGKLLKDVSVRNSPAVKVEEADEDIELTDAIVVPQTKANRSGLAEELNLFAPTTKRSVYTFYFHSPYFCLFRLYQILYERLLKMKSLDDQIKSNPALGKKFNQTALELDLYTNRFEDIDLSNGYYNALLQVIHHFFEGELDQANYEESVRYIFGTDAYTIFTVDKVIQALIKQIQAVAADKKSTDFASLFNTTHVNGAYRYLAEEIVPDETLYKITSDTSAHQATIYVLDKEHIPSQQEIYEEYIASYIDWMHDTKGVDRSLLKPSFLNRNLVKSVVKRPSTFVKPQLRYKVHEASYHMYYIVGSEDVYYRQSNSKEREDEANSENSGSRWQELISANDNLTGDALLNYQ